MLCHPAEPKPRLRTDSRFGLDPPEFAAVTEIAAPTDRRLCDLLAYWEGKRAGREMPVRQDLRPSEIRRLLPHVYLMDVIDGSFRFRLRGTAIDARLGRGRTGLTLEECHYGPYLPVVKASLQSCIDRRAPVTTTGVTIWSRQNDCLQYESCRMPLAGADGAVAMLLCGMIFREPLAPQSPPGRRQVA